jgi:hypothetical protein
MSQSREDLNEQLNRARLASRRQDIEVENFLRGVSTRDSGNRESLSIETAAMQMERNTQDQVSRDKFRSHQ